VKLGQLYIIREVVIYRRLDPYNDDLVDFDVSIYGADGLVTSTYVSSAGTNPIITIKFNDIVGESVKIQLHGVHRILSLAEVQVYGSLREFYVEIGQMIGKNQVNEIALVQYTEDAEVNIEEEISELSDIVITKGSLSPIVVSFTLRFAL
jgi:hypothetical protein